MKDAAAGELVRIGFWSAVGGALFSATIVLALIAVGAVTLPGAVKSMNGAAKATAKPCGCS